MPARRSDLARQTHTGAGLSVCDLGARRPDPAEHQQCVAQLFDRSQEFVVVSSS